MKTFNETHRNRTRDLPAYGAMPQPQRAHRQYTIMHTAALVL
jgi:hypothetical protein